MKKMQLLLLGLPEHAAISQRQIAEALSKHGIDVTLVTLPELLKTKPPLADEDLIFSKEIFEEWMRKNQLNNQTFNQDFWVKKMQKLAQSPKHSIKPGRIY